MRSYVFYASVKVQLNWQQKRATCFATSLLRGWGWGVILGNLGGGVPPGTPNPALISDPKMSFSTPVFRPSLKHYWLAFRPEIT